MHKPENPIAQKVIDDVKKHGWHVIKVMADAEALPFAYTIGLYQTFHHPEIIVVGLPVDTGHVLLNIAGDGIRAGGTYREGMHAEEFLDEYRCPFRSVHARHYPTYLGWAMWFYGGEDFSVLQLVYPDRYHQWPWDPGVEPSFRLMQPILTSADDESPASKTG